MVHSMLALPSLISASPGESPMRPYPHYPQSNAFTESHDRTVRHTATSYQVHMVLNHSSHCLPFEQHHLMSDFHHLLRFCVIASYAPPYCPGSTTLIQKPFKSKSTLAFKTTIISPIPTSTLISLHPSTLSNLLLCLTPRRGIWIPGTFLCVFPKVSY